MNFLTSPSFKQISIPAPPNTYDGLTKTGYFNLLATSKASSTVNTVEPRGRSIWHFSRISSNLSLSSAASTSSAEVPKILTPISINALVSLIAVCPPNWTIAPSGFSISTIFSTSSGVNGSKYKRSAISKSVLTVSGLLLTIIVS